MEVDDPCISHLLNGFIEWEGELLLIRKRSREDPLELRACFTHAGMNLYKNLLLKCCTIAKSGDDPLKLTKTIILDSLVPSRSKENSFTLII